MTLATDTSIAASSRPRTATRRCRSLAIDLNNAGVALMSIRCVPAGARSDRVNDSFGASRVLGEAIRMMQQCLRRRRNPSDGFDRWEEGVENAEEVLAAARRRIDDVTCEGSCECSSASDDFSSTCCGPIELSLHDFNVDDREHEEDNDDDASSLQTLREDCAVMMHNIALSHQRDGSSDSSQFKALSYFEMALLLLQRGDPREDDSTDGGASSPRRASSCGGTTGARTGGGGAPSRRERDPDRDRLSRRLVLSSVSNSARIHGGLGNHSAAEEYGNELSRLLMMMTEEELVGLRLYGSDDNAAAAA